MRRIALAALTLLLTLLFAASFAKAQTTITSITPSATTFSSNVGYLWSDGLVHPIPQPQTPTPPPTPQPNDDVNVSVTTEYIHFTNGASGTMIEAVRPISDYWSLGYAQVIVPPAKANFYLLGPRYDTDLSHIFKKAKPSHLDLSLIKVFVGGGLGTRRDDLGNSPTFAYGAHAGFAIPVGSLLKAKVGFNVSAGFIGAAKQAIVGPRILTAFSSVVNGQYAAGVTLVF